MNGLNLSNIQDAKLGGTQVSAIYFGSTQLWPQIDYSKEYLTFKARESGTFTFTGYNSNSLSYSVDNGLTWTALASGTASPTISAGNKIIWKGYCVPSTTHNATGGIGNFSSTGTFDVKGNIMSLLYNDNFTNELDLSSYTQAFYHLFKNSKAVNADNLILPATTIVKNCYEELFMGCTSLLSAQFILPSLRMYDGCYAHMFDGCTSLTLPPELPATTLDIYCYYMMFTGCTSLTTAPDLPASTLKNYCYRYMFQNCSSLNKVKCLATSISASGCLTSWLSNVSSSGTFTKKSTMSSFTSGASGIPSGWTVVNV